MFKKKEKDPNEKKLNFGKFMAWKSSDVSAAWVNWIVNTYFSLYCINTLKVDMVVVGVILLVTNIFDALTDILIGFVIDKSPVTKLGKVRPYELAIIGVTICTAVMFMCPDGAPEWLKYIWISLFYTLTFGIFNTMRYGASVPYLVKAFDNDRGLIGKVSAFGGFVTTMGAAIVTFVFPKLMGAFAYDSVASAEGVVYLLNTSGWTKLMLIVMIPATVIAIFRFIFVKEDTSIDTGKEAIPFDFKQVKEMLFKNKYVWYYALLIFAFNVIQYLGITAYYFQYVYQNSDSVGTISLMSYFLLPLLLVIPALLKKFGASKIIWAASIIACFGYALNFFAYKSMPLLITGSILSSLAILPISYLGNVLLAQIFNYNEYKGIARQEATTTALASSVASQLGQGIGPFVTSIVLTISGFNAELELNQPDSALLGIRILYSFVPLVFMILIFFAAKGIQKLEDKAPEIESKIKNNHLNSAQET